MLRGLLKGSEEISYFQSTQVGLLVASSKTPLVPAELTPVYSDYVELVKAGNPTVDVEEKLLRLLSIDEDLLITYGLNNALNGTNLPHQLRSLDTPGQ